MDNSFWAFAALIIFLAIVWYLKAPAKVGATLDQRADRIRNELAAEGIEIMDGPQGSTWRRI